MSSSGWGMLAILLLAASQPAPAATAEAELTSLSRFRTVAIVGGTIHTLGPAGTLEKGTLVFSGGRITAVGRDLRIPEGAHVIDATGKVVTPGLFDSLSRIGIVEISLVPQTDDDSVRDERTTASFDVADAFNPRSVLVPINRVEGLTRVLVAPAPGSGVIAGRGAIAHLGGESDSVVRSPAALFAWLGEEGKALAKGSRAAALLRLREAFEDALDYSAYRDAYNRNVRRTYALSRLDLEALGPVVRGELPLVVSVDRASDIEAALRLGREYRLRLVLSGVAEGWMVAQAIAAARVPVILDPLTNLPDRFEALGATLENAARLAAAGVTVLFGTGEAHNGRNLKQAAGNAVAYGLPWEDALRAMTINPARVWRLEDRYGTLDPGKDADVVIWDGDPLEVTTFADAVFIRGVEMPMRTRQTELRDRYLDLHPLLPPAYHKP